MTDVIIVETDDITVVDVINIETETIVDVIDIATAEVVEIGNLGAGPGPQGPPGDDAQWTSMTQAAYDSLPVKDPNTLYVIVN